MAKNILLLLFASICISAAAQKSPFKLVTTQLSKGYSPGNDYIQLLVDGVNTCSEKLGGDSIANLSHIAIYDSNLDSIFIYQGVDTLWGLGSGKYRFPNKAPWDSISFGSQILIYNDKNKNPDIKLFDDIIGTDNHHFFVIPLSDLELIDSASVDTASVPSVDSILPSPSGLALSNKEGVEATLLNPILSPNFTTNTSDWSVGSSNNDLPGNNKRVINTWIDGLLVPATKPFSFSISPNPQILTQSHYDSTLKMVVTDTVQECPPVNVFLTQTGLTLPDSSVNLTWAVNGVVDTIFGLTGSGTPDTTIYGGDTLTVNMYHGDVITLTGTTNLKCITGSVDTVVQFYTRPSIAVVPPPLRAYITTDSLAVPLIDSLYKDSTGSDSSLVYMQFCYGSRTRFHAHPDSSSSSDQYTWIHKGIIVSYDSTYIDSNITKGIDTVLFHIHSNVPCLINKDLYDTIVITGLDSIAIPKITITGDTGVCSNVKDTFTATLTPSPIGDSTAKYKLVWFVGNQNGNSFVYADTTNYLDGDQRVKMFVDSTTNPGDSVQVILLASKTNSCPYRKDSLFIFPPTLQDTLALRDTSNTLHLIVTPAINPTIQQPVISTQGGLCKFPFVDSIQFTATSDSTLGAGTNPKFLWYLNGVLQQSNNSISIYSGTDSARTGSDSIYAITNTSGTDSAVYIANGNLRYGSDTIGVQMINTTYTCFVNSDTSAMVTLPIATFNPYPPTPSVTISPSQPLPLCSAGLPQNVVMTPLGQQLGNKPIYLWTLNGTPVSDSSAYVYNKIVANDSITLFAKSSVGCAQPDTVNAGLTITITNAVAPSVTIASSADTFCANQPPTITPTPVNGGTSPVYVWYKVGTNGNPDSSLGNSGVGSFNFPPVTDTSSVLTWQVYCQMTSNASCLTNNTAISDTITLTINPYPNVAPIVGSSSVCNGAYITLTDATPSGSWISFSPYNATVDANGNVTGVNVGQATIIYNVGNAYGCFGTQNTTIYVNPTNVTFDSLLHYNICTFPGMNMDTIYNDSTHGNWGIDPTSTAVGTVAPAFDMNNIPIGLVTATSNGLLYITDTIVNGCGTTVRRDTILVGPPIVPSIQGASGICVLGDSTLLTDTAAVQAGWTSIWTTSGNGNTILADTLYGTPSTVYVKAQNSGSDNITYSVTNICGTASSATFTINVGPPATAGTINPNSGNGTICINSQTTLNDGVQGGIWVSQTPSIATVDQNGNVTGISNGTDSIFYKVGNTCDTIYTGYQVTVIPAYTLPPIIGDTIVCNTGIYDTVQYATAATGAISSVWNVTNTNLATIDPNLGLLTASTSNQGIDTVIYSYTNTCGTKYDSITVVVGNPIIGPLSYKNPICAADTIIISSIGTRGATSYLWYSLNPTIANFVDNSDTLYGVSGGKATFFYEISNKCGIVSNVINDTTTINVISLPVVPPIVGKTSICLGDTAIMSDTATTGIWTSSNAKIASINAVGNILDIKGTATGNTLITYTEVNSTGCRDSMSQTLVVDSIPVVQPITGVDSLCFGATDTLKNATPTLNVTATWSSSNPSVATVESGVVVGVQAGKDTIQYLVVDGNGCRDSVTAHIHVNPTPTIDSIQGLITLCVGKSFLFTDGVTGGVWSNLGEGYSSIKDSGYAAWVTGLKTGNDTLRYKVTALGCDTTTSFSLGITTPHVAPITAANKDTAVNVGLTIQLNDDSTGVWNSLDPSIASISDNGVVTGNSVTPYDTVSIQYTYTDLTGCQASAYQTVKVLPQLNDVYAPNFFHPNSVNHENRKFMVLGKDIASLDLKVFSPWGEELYSTTNPDDEGWDGTNKSGKAEPSGVYVYTAKITLKSGVTINKKGAVNLIR